MILDNVVFHTEEDYPPALALANAATHMGYYWSWIVRRGLYNPEWDEAAEEDMGALKAQAISGAEFVLNNMAGCLEDSDFNEEGCRFSLYYYDDEEEGYGRFIEDYLQKQNKPALEIFYNVEIYD
ncbi:MAG: cell surface protein [Snodgrassella alvi]|nr:cell surface protein [Snodgrassella alvi]